jgi:hypothetical protein
MIKIDMSAQERANRIAWMAAVPSNGLYAAGLQPLLRVAIAAGTPSAPSTATAPAPNRRGSSDIRASLSWSGGIGPNG